MMFTSALRKLHVNAMRVGRSGDLRLKDQANQHPPPTQTIKLLSSGLGPTQDSPARHIGGDRSVPRTATPSCGFVSLHRTSLSSSAVQRHQMMSTQEIAFLLRMQSLLGIHMKQEACKQDENRNEAYH
ncbi:hypothetical protein ScPMuIL_004201 [Solemya velum]